MTKNFLLLLLLSLSFALKSQVIVVNPEYPLVNSDVTVIFDATQGNGALKDYTGTVYAHTGVITSESTNSSDWKHVVANWATADPKVEMTSLGNNKYKIAFNIKKFYGILPGEQVLQLAFLFRNADGSKVGRSSSNNDIFYSVNPDSIATEYQSSIYRNDSLIINCSTGKIFIVPFADDIFNISSIPQGTNELDSSYSTVLTPHGISTQFTETDKELKLSTNSNSVVFKKASLLISLLAQSDTITTSVKPFSFSIAGGILGFKLDNSERIYGTGSRAIGLDRRGQILNVYNNASYGYSFGATNLNICMPIITSSKGYSIFIDNHSRATWDIGSTVQNKILYNYQSGASSFFFIGGGSYANIVKNICLLTGRQPLPPRWALGYIQSKYGYQTEQEARGVVTTLRNNKFPLDAIVLDLYWFGSPQTMGKLDWDYGRFPNPTKMLSDFKTIGVKTILISEPYFTQQTSNFSIASQNGYLGKNSNGDSYVLGSFWAGSAGLLDITNPSAANWMWSFYKARTNEGVAGWWTDLGEPESHPNDMVHFSGKKANDIHNIFGLEWAKTIYTNWRTDYPNQRLFNLTRAGYAGMQRYSTFPWSGDIQRSFDGLKAQIPIMLSMGLSGVGYMHSDVGGFTGGGQDNELFTRWVQFGVFAPVFRIHGTGIPTEPTAYSASTQSIVRKFINLRYSLLPYNYSLAWENTVTGEPIARPLDYYESGNTLLQNNNDEYFWGSRILVAPIIQQGQTSRNVIFPSGKWVDWWTNTSYNGYSSASISAPIDKIPLFVKSGSFIPTIRPVTSTDFYKGDSLFIKFFVDKDVPSSNFTLYDDDGQNPESIGNGEYQLIQFTNSTASDQVEIGINGEGNGYSGCPQKREIFFELPNIGDSPAEVEVNGLSVSKLNSYAELLNSLDGWFWSSSPNVLNIHVPWSGNSTIIKIKGTSVGVNPIYYNDKSITISDLWPNPAQERVNFTITVLKKQRLSISILGAMGNNIYTFDPNEYSTCNNSFEYDASGLNPGLYFLRVSGEFGTITKKWIKR